MAAKRRPAPLSKTAAEARATVKRMCDLAECEVSTLEKKFRMPFPHLRKDVQEARKLLTELVAVAIVLRWPRQSGAKGVGRG